jgi:hypothetical protein
MSTGTAFLARIAIASEKARTRREFVPPSYALRDMPSDLPKDQIGREIALLLWDHPEVAEQVGNVNLRTLSLEAKREMLESVRDMLGIKPIRRRRLGYVG